MINRETITIDKQAAFDLAVSKLYKQGTQAIDHEGDCCFLTDSGKRCAVGWLLDDDVISTATVGGVFTLVNGLGFKLNEDTEEFLGNMQQYLHDSLEKEHFRTQLIDAAEVFAEHHKLTFDREKFNAEHADNND